MRKSILVTTFVLFLTLGITSFLYATTPIGTKGDALKKFEVKTGESATMIADHLEEQGIIRSASGLYVLSIITGSAFDLKSGIYELSRASSTHAILQRLVEGPDRERTVLIREGETIYDVDAALAFAGVLPEGALIAAQDKNQMMGLPWLEGRLFPDTYRFNVSSTVEEVIGKFENNFEAKAGPLLVKDPEHLEKTLILASIIEREIPEPHDRRIVAGILLKRLHEGMPLQVDATVCYVKEMKAPSGGTSCYPLLSVDLAASSPYNTYANRGLPPHPIGNPGVGAIEAALDPLESPYWYYLSAEESGKTVFARTLDEHRANRLLYLAK